jgi:hypothetical protein
MTTGPTALPAYRLEALRSQRFDIELRKKLLAKITQIVWLFRAMSGIFVQWRLFRAKPLGREITVGK